MTKDANVLPPIHAEVGELFDISVPTNPSTGFASTLSEMTKCAYLVGSTYVPNNQQIPGSGGTQVYKFVAIEKGEGPIEFRDVKFSRPLDISPQTPMQKRFVIVS